MHELKSHLEETARLIKHGLETADLVGKKAALARLNEEMAKGDFWDDPKAAQEVSQQASDLAKTISNWEAVSEEVESLLGLLPEVDEEALAEFELMVKALDEKWNRLSIATFLSGKHDADNAIMAIYAGTGGTDAADFAEMLLRMYLRYCERMGFRAEVLERSEADEAGIKSASFTVKGEFAYGYLKGEHGVHRLVRTSPFNSKGSRETSFAMVEVLPEIKATEQLEIDSDDLRIDVYRASGKGGQGVNTTDSAVRITHLPTGIVVQCQNERSQLQNKEQAMGMLQARLTKLMEERQAAELSELKGEKVEYSWGNQIRSYVLHPYKMVKDHRTGHEESNPERVLDGEIEGFVEATLKVKS